MCEISFLPSLGIRVDKSVQHCWVQQNSCKSYKILHDRCVGKHRRNSKRPCKGAQYYLRLFFVLACEVRCRCKASISSCKHPFLSLHDKKWWLTVWECSFRFISESSRELSLELLLGLPVIDNRRVSYIFLSWLRLASDSDNCRFIAINFACSPVKQASAYKLNAACGTL